jgi:hypothetical protein
MSTIKGHRSGVRFRKGDSGEGDRTTKVSSRLTREEALNPDMPLVAWSVCRDSFGAALYAVVRQ